MSGGNVAGGVLAGLVLTLLVALATEMAWLGRVLLLLALVALVVLLVPRWRRAGAGFVMGLALGSMVAAGVCGALAESAPRCDQGAVDDFRSLPSFPGVDFQLHIDPGTGECTGAVSTPDAEAFLSHYEEAMREAGWRVSTQQYGSVIGLGPVGGVMLELRPDGQGNVRVLILRSDTVDPAEYGL